MSDREKLWTPGPWWIERETGDVVARDGDWEICTFSRSDSQQPYDTQLISAAPDLVDAGEQLFAEFESLCNVIPALRNSNAYIDMKKAIDKAYGDSQ